MPGNTLNRLAALAVVPVLAALALVLLATGTAGADASCRTGAGRFSLTALTGPDCTSPVGICARGSYLGPVLGSADFIATTLVPTVDTPATGVVLLTGDNSFDLRDGTLLTKDAIVLKTTGAGDFAEVDTIVGGTGAWAGATGTLRGQGTFTVQGGGQGSYEGEVCFP